jgi:RNA polymerase-binding transcription factor
MLTNANLEGLYEFANFNPNRFGVFRMDKRRLELFKKRLLERKEQLLDTVSKAEQDGREADEESAQDIADKATNSYTKEFLFKKSNDDRFILQLVNEALDRLENGAFGTCVACGGEMQHKRLDAVPWARHCIDCQEKQERGLLES